MDTTLLKITLSEIRQEIRDNATPQTLESSTRFFKEPVKSYGVKVPVVHAISKAYFKRINSFSKSDIWNLCTQLWKSGYTEEAIVACNWSYTIRKQYQPSDFSVFEDWINRYVTNWATCDTLCNHTVGSFIEMYPEELHRLKALARSSNLWMRRAAAVSLIVPARKGKFLPDIFAIADIVLEDQEDLVLKGYGWMLKEACKAHQQEVWNYVMKNKHAMPRTALRYAIEKMPEEMKKKAMA